MTQLVEMMCNGDFFNKDPDEVWQYLDSLVDSAQTWDPCDGTEHLKQLNKGGGMYLLKNEEDDVNARIASLTRKVEVIELGNSLTTHSSVWNL